MSRPVLGELVTRAGKVVLDLPRLLETRMLVQAGSGFGKSWACRRLLEQTAGKVQQIVIDPDGEFSTLREKHDYVIAAANNGDALAHPRTAALLARRLLETGVSAVLDIYDLKAHERHDFVKIFCNTMVDAPKSLWQPVLVLLDEAHVYCPEQGESSAAGAVIDLATRGRKRGYGLVLATQRLSKLNKDAAAEAFNKLIGRCQLDVDVKRAAAELGMTPKDALEAFKTFEPGEFFAFGPALSATVERMRTGAVETTHPKAGQRGLRAPPAPTAAIKAMLPKLADLPKEAEQEARSIEDLRRELAAVRKELTLAKKATPAPSKRDANDAAALRAAAASIKRLKSAIEALMKFVVHINATDFAKDAGVDPAELRKAIDSAVDQAVKNIDRQLGQRTAGLQSLQRAGEALLERVKKALEQNDDVSIDIDVRHQPPFAVSDLRARAAAARTELPKGEVAILSACIQFPEGLRRDQLTVLSGYKRSTRDAYVQRLAEKGYVVVQGDKVVATEEGTAALPDAEPLPTGPELQRYWLERLPEGERKILEVLIARYPDGVVRDALSDETGYKRSTRDAYIQRMTAKQLVSEPARGEVRASETLF